LIESVKKLYIDDVYELNHISNMTYV